MIIFRKQKGRKKDVWQESLWDAASGDAPSTGIGFAVDIGTTTVVVAALDFQRKKILGTLSQTNKQTKLGADVMMRIMHCLAGRQEILHQLVIQQVESMAGQLLGQQKNQSSPYLFSIVGNTTMCHLFLNKSVKGLAGYPFLAAYHGNYQCTGIDIGMERFPSAKVCVLSGIAAHIGSDALAVIGAECLYQKGKNQLAIDLGTNAEIILNKQGKLSVCSTAAGPAFEGKGIACGMAAKAGAITGVKLAAHTGNQIIEVLEADNAQGLCSSGLVDLLAELRKCSILLENGYLLGQNEAAEHGIHPEFCSRLVSRNGEHAFLLCPKQEGQPEVYLPQSDIRHLQLAKGAIQAGVSSLLSAAQLSIEDIDEFVVAGALGSSVRQTSALRIGLFPAASLDSLRFVGNAAGTGAALGLVHPAFPKKMETLAKKISQLEIAQEKGFQECLLQSMDLREWV